jgi:hypothetical protein
MTAPGETGPREVGLATGCSSGDINSGYRWNVEIISSHVNHLQEKVSEGPLHQAERTVLSRSQRWLRRVPVNQDEKTGEILIRKVVRQSCRGSDIVVVWGVRAAEKLARRPRKD